MPISRNAVPSASRSSSGRAAANSVSGSTRRRRQPRVAGAEREARGLQLQHHAAGGEALLRLSRRDSFSHIRQSGRSSASADGEVGVEGGLGADAARFALRHHRARVLAAGARGQPPARPRRSAAPPRSGDSAASWPSRVNPAAASRRAIAGPTPGSKVTGSGASKAAASAAPITAKPRGLSRSAAILASRRFGASPTETVTPTSRSTSSAKRASTAAGGARCSAAVPDEVEHRLVDRQRLHQRRQAPHQRADAARRGDVLRHVRADHHRVRAEPQRLEHRHGAAHARGPGDVAGGGDHAAPAAADDHRQGQQLRPVALLDAGVEGVAIHMRDGELQQLRMPQQPPRAAGARRPRPRPAAARQRNPGTVASAAGALIGAAATAAPRTRASSAGPTACSAGDRGARASAIPLASNSRNSAASAASTTASPAAASARRTAGPCRGGSLSSTLRAASGSSTAIAAPSSSAAAIPPSRGASNSSRTIPVAAPARKASAP